MAIIHRDLPAGHSEYDFPITVEGLTLTVGAGSFRCEGDRALAEDQEFTVTPHAELMTWVGGKIVVHKETNEVVLLVDEVVEGEDQFDLAFSSYRLLLRLFKMVVPAGVTSLDDVEIRVTRRVKSEAEE